MTESYRILMVAPTSFFLDYGCHVRILEEARILQKQGHHVTLITYYLGRDLPDLEIVRTRPTPWRSDYEVGSSLHKVAFDMFLGWTGLKTVLRQPFDVVHGHLHEGALIGYPLSRLRGIPLVGDFQGSMTSEMVDHHFLDPEGPWYRWAYLLEHRIVQLPDAIVTSTALSAEIIRQEFKCRDVVYALPDSVNVDFFRPDLLTPEAVIAEREKLGLPTDKPVVAYLGLLADYQGTHLLIEAAQILHQRGVEAHFLIMGFPGIQRYRQMADELGVLDCTTFTGKIPYEQAPKHLALGDIAVAPKLSDTEGAGKILNYMAMALPTVAFETPVSREYLGELGTYADATGDPRSLADAIERLIEHRELRTALGRKLRARVARHFSLDHLGEQLVDVYQGLLTKRHKT